jgi:hypothetical protein
MAEPGHQGVEFHAEAVGLTDDSVVVDGHVHCEPGMSDAEVEAEVTERYGFDHVQVGERVDPAPRGRGKSTAFFGGGRWRSPWDPHAPEGDSRLH